MLASDPSSRRCDVGGPRQHTDDGGTRVAHRIGRPTGHEVENGTRGAMACRHTLQNRPDNCAHAHNAKNAVSALPKVMKRVALGELSRPPRTCGGRLVNGKAVSAAARQSRRKSRGYGGFGAMADSVVTLDFEDPAKGYERNLRVALGNGSLRSQTIGGPLSGL